MGAALISLVLPVLLCKGQNVEIRCNFNMDGAERYSCDAGEFSISQSNSQTITIVGNHLPNQTNMDVVSTVVSNQPLPFVITEFFTTFPNLRHYTTFGGLHEIQEDAFQLAQNLEDFSVFISPLRELPAYSFSEATKLTHLGIVQCDNFERIDHNALFGLNNLEIIQILATSLRFIPENVFSSLTNLKIIDLSDNRIQTLPARLFDNNLILEDINFYYNNMNAVARGFVENFVNLRNLREFTFIGNSCGNSTYHPSNVNPIHSALQQCYENYEQRRQLSLDLQGSLIIRDENGNVILDIYN